MTPQDALRALSEDIDQIARNTHGAVPARVTIALHALQDYFQVNYDLAPPEERYYVPESSGDWVTVPPSGVVTTDQYRIDFNKGVITLLGPEEEIGR